MQISIFCVDAMLRAVARNTFASFFGDIILLIITIMWSEESVRTMHDKAT